MNLGLHGSPAVTPTLASPSAMARWARTHRARSTATTASLAAILAAGGCSPYEPRPLIPATTGTLLQARTLADPGLAQFLANQHLRGAANSTAADWDFESLAAVAVYFHPDLALARAQLSAANAAELTAGGRPNPTITLSGGFNSSALPGIIPWFPGLTFDVPIETAGKRTYRRTKAAFLTAAAWPHLWETAWTLRRTLRLALFDLALAQRRVGLLQEQSRLEARRGQSLAQRLAAGIATRPEMTTNRPKPQDAVGSPGCLPILHRSGAR